MKIATKEKKPFIASSPVNIELTRFKTRFLSPTPSRTTNLALTGSLLVSYLVILGMCFNFRADLNPIGVLFLQMFLLMLVGPAAGYPAIAGERDRRSWDLLQTAPITQGAIVRGKFQGVASLILALMAAGLPVVLLSAIFYHNYESFSLLSLIVSELSTMAIAFAFAAYTIYNSSKAKSANAALASTIGSLVGVFAILPLAIAFVFQNSQLALPLCAWHPMVILEAILLRSSDSDAVHHLVWGPLAGVLGTIGYLGVTAFFLKITTNRLERDKHLH